MNHSITGHTKPLRDLQPGQRIYDRIWRAGGTGAERKAS